MSNNDINNNNKEETCNYVGIGSMMNPISLKLRNLYPLESFPVKCLNSVRRFWGAAGMAELFEEDGSSFHAVLHIMTLSDMKKLDEIERQYIRREVTCEKYDGTIIKAYGYEFDKSKLSTNISKPPSERYIDIMTQGMLYYKCDINAINELKNTPNQVPRKKVEEFSKFIIPDEYKNTIYTWNDIKGCNGLNDKQLRIVVNGKVFQLVHPINISDEDFEKRKLKDSNFGGTDTTVTYAKMIYEPKYSPCNTIYEMSDEHKAWVEDLAYNFINNPPIYYTCIGRVEPAMPPIE